MTHQGAIRCLIGTKLPYVYESSRELIVKIKRSETFIKCVDG